MRFGAKSLGVIVVAVAALLAAGAGTGAAQQKAASAEEIYKQQCAACHDSGLPRTPNRAALSRLAQENIRFALTKGAMKEQGAKLKPEQVEALARYLSAVATVKEDANACPAGEATLKDPMNEPRWNGWGGDVMQHRAQNAAMAGLKAEDVAKLKVKWAFGFPGVSRANAQPTVFGGRVYVGSRGRKVYSLNAGSGCKYWEFETEGPVRTAMSVGPYDGGWAVYFGDQSGNAYALDAATGKLLWKTRVDDHAGAVITGAPTLAGGRLYVPVTSGEEGTGADPKYECCKFRGSVVALDAATGKLVWKTYTVTEEPKPVRKNKLGVQLWGPSGAGVWSSPTVDEKKRRVYVATGDSYSDPAAPTSDAFIAFDADTGKMLWAKQITAGDAYVISCEGPEETRANCPEANGPDFDFGSSPILVELPGGKKVLVAGQKSGVVTAVDPDRDGEILWQTRVGKGGSLGGVQWGSAADAEKVYVALSDIQTKEVPAGTPGSQPDFEGGALLLDAKSGGGMFALKLANGEMVWKTPHPGCGDTPGCSPAQSAAVTLIPGVVFSGGVDGHLRAYSTRDGKIIWDVDTKQSYKTVNGVKANGGAMDGPGAVIVGGTLYVNSGYGMWGGAPGNVLLAFTVDGK